MEKNSTVFHIDKGMHTSVNIQVVSFNRLIENDQQSIHIISSQSSSACQTILNQNVSRSSYQ